MNRDTYITIQGWMVDELGLSGSRLMAYAIIHGFSQDGESWYRGGWRYIAEWIGCVENTARKVLADLVDAGLVEKRGGQPGTAYEYRTVEVERLAENRPETVSEEADDPTKFWEGGVPNSGRGVYQNLGADPTKIWEGGVPNSGSLINVGNIKGNTKGNIGDINAPAGAKPKKTGFDPPTVEQVRAYALQQGYQIDAQAFHDYHQTRGWRLRGGIPMKDWKAAVRTWAATDRKWRDPGKGVVRDEFAKFNR